MSNRGADPEERRAEILQAAMACFARTGYHGTSMDDIVKEVGLSKGTLYWYFKNKQSLFMAIVEETFGQLSAQFQQIVAQSEGASVAERLKLALEVSGEFMVAEADKADLFIEFWAQTKHDEELNAFFIGMYQPYIDGMTALIEEGIASGEFRPVAAETVSAALVGLLDGLGLQAMVGLSTIEKLDVDALVDWVLGGLRAKG